MIATYINFAMLSSLALFITGGFVVLALAIFLAVRELVRAAST